MRLPWYHPSTLPNHGTPGEYPEQMELTIQAADLLVNAGLGFGVGVVASVLLFRRGLAL